MKSNYYVSLLCLTHLLAHADGVMDENEIDALRLIKENEGIPDEVFREVQSFLQEKKEKEIFERGIDQMSCCSDAEKMKVFVTLYKLSEVDGRVHVKEIRLLLYSIKIIGFEFDDVVREALMAPALL